MDTEKYLDFVQEALKDRQEPGGIPQDAQRYFAGHRPRFRAALEILKHCQSHIDVVLDLGTCFPYLSLYFHLVHGADVYYGAPVEGIESYNDSVVYHRLNLCAPTKLPHGDLVICTECLEHLPCNIYSVVAYLKSLSWQYVFLSFPCGNKNAKDYDKVYGDYNVIHNEHIREFTAETAKQFTADDDFVILEAQFSSQPLYGAPIWNVLLGRKHGR